ncbi:MAG: hypothetical protein PF588_09695 [Candidatus Kapabacteria bacterium]|jgi:hypothetical protein|nr:hypothetical protein [Candidatus Kapabacteria bacterium]
MNRQILTNYPCDSDYRSPWIPTRIEKTPNQMKELSAVSLQIAWDQLTGTPDAVLEIIVTNDLKFSTIAKTINIDSASNLNDSLMIMMNSSFAYFGIRFIKNSVTGGKLSVSLAYG